MLGSVLLGPSTSTSSTAPIRSAFSAGCRPLDSVDQPLDPIALEGVRDLIRHRSRLGPAAR
jgi:hypothetical protein